MNAQILAIRHEAENESKALKKRSKAKKESDYEPSEEGSNDDSFMPEKINARNRNLPIQKMQKQLTVHCEETLKGYLKVFDMLEKKPNLDREELVK